MYRNILIISDNLDMVRFFEEFVNSNECYSKFRFSISISPFSDINKFEEVIKSHVFVFDLKDKSNIDFIIMNYDLVISIHCKQLFPKQMVNAIKCINVHPGFNPINRGWYPQVFAIINNLPIGATIHEIDEHLDHGNVIDQDFVEKESFDTSLSLYNKIQELEKVLIKNNLMKILMNEYSSYPPKGDDNLFLKSDFRNLCKLNLDENMRVGETINLLRALTHGDYNNAYFVDEKTNKKVFIKVSLFPED